MTTELTRHVSNLFCRECRRELPSQDLISQAREAVRLTKSIPLRLRLYPKCPCGTENVVTLHFHGLSEAQRRQLKQEMCG
jgi:hypothetical protein